jgi:hypothetical protein
MRDPTCSLYHERKFTEQLANDNLTPPQFRRWNKCESGHRFMAYPEKQLVVFTLDDDLDLDRHATLTCSWLTLHPYDGMLSTWKVADSEQAFLVGHVPVEIYPGCFLFHPKVSEVTYATTESVSNIRFSMAYRTQSNPKNRRAGGRYILEKSFFKDMFDGKVI